MTLIPEMYDEFVHYLNERESIRLKRETGFSGPWTVDPILSKYKFTNVSRANDWTTRWVVKNWYNPNRHQSLEVQAMSCAIFRYFGSAEFAEACGYPSEWDPEKLLRTATLRLASGQKVFTGAYIITNQGMRDPKQNVVVTHFLTPYRFNIETIVRVAQSGSFQDTCEFLQTLPGMGAFMSKEIALDLMLTPVLEKAHDRHTWSPVGPGAIRGLNRLHGRPLNKNMTQAAGLAEMQELLGMLAQEKPLRGPGDLGLFYGEDVPKGEGLIEAFPRIGVDFGVTDVQFCLCETDKYLRVKNDEGRPRSGYNWKKARPQP